MINIFDDTLGLSVTLEGKIKEIPKKINHNEIISIQGFRFTEMSRGVIDISLDIIYINETNYRTLQDLFLYSKGTLIIENLDRGQVYKNYYIQGDTINLDEYENLEEQEYYYKGNILLNKV